MHAGAGGVGQLPIQLAKRRGAIVFATNGNVEKAQDGSAGGGHEKAESANWSLITANSCAAEPEIVR